MEQLTFEITDVNTKETLKNIAIECFTENHFDTTKIKVYSNETKGKITGYSLSYGGSLILKTNIKLTAILFDRNLIPMISIRDYSKKQEVNNPQNFVKYTFKSYYEEILMYVRQVIHEYIKNYIPPIKFGCCHRYMQCSDSRKCIAPDQGYAKGCQYRKNLENGRIFYGKNANTKTISGGGDSLETSFETKKE